MRLFEVIIIILPVFLLMGLGYLLRRVRLLDSSFFHQANRLVYFVCLPALLFYKIGSADFKSNFNGTMVLGASAALVIGFLLSYLYAALRRYRASDLGTFSQGAFRGNLAYIGLPIVLSAYGETAFARAGMLMGCLVPVLNLLSILALVLPHRKAEEGQPPAAYKVALGFAAPEGDRPGSRVFNVKLQGNTVLSGFDIVKEAGGPGRALWKEFDDITASTELTLELVAPSETPTDAQMPLINGLKILRK